MLVVVVRWREEEVHGVAVVVVVVVVVIFTLTVRLFYTHLLHRPV